MPEEKNYTKEKEAKESRGERLRSLRKAKGLSLEEVHQRTKIHIGVLKALEEDTVVNMAPAYVKGLLKIYCSFLGVDFKDFIEEQSKEEYVSDSTPIKPRVSIAVIKKGVKLKLRPIIFVVCLLVLTIALFKIGQGISIRQKSGFKKESPTEVVSTKKEVSSPAPVITNPRLGIRAKENCWLEVKTDGKTVFKGVIKKGRFEYWEAKKAIEFSLGSAGGVEVEVNGRLFSPLGRRGKVIKNIKVTKEGLTVPK